MHRLIRSLYEPFLAYAKSRFSQKGLAECKLIFIPPAYEVYRGYIVFAFSVCVCACEFVNFFLSNISRKLLDLGF